MDGGSGDQPGLEARRDPMIDELTYDAELNFVRVTMSGDIPDHEFRRVLEFLTTSQDFPPEVNVLWDIRKIEFFNLNTSFLKNLGEIRDDYADKRNPARAAILVPGDVEASIVRLFRDISKMPDNHLKITESVDEAEDWCRSEDPS